MFTSRRLFINSFINDFFHITVSYDLPIGDVATRIVILSLSFSFVGRTQGGATGVVSTGILISASVTVFDCHRLVHVITGQVPKACMYDFFLLIAVH